ncbi:MAG: VOC family protein [Actinomycetota bacterium]
MSESPEQTGFVVQVVIDCDHAHRLADWWAETLRWEVEPQDESFIRKMIAEGVANDSDTVTWNGALVWKGTVAIRPIDGFGPGQPRILFQDVTEPKSVKNRIHLDVRAAGEDLDELRARLTERGATPIGSGQQGPHHWVVFADPEGNEFCV